MRVLAYEFITGGGLAGEPLPASLAREGELMLSAMLRGLAALPGVEALSTRDARLPDPAGVTALRPRPGEDGLALFRRALAGCDAAWVLAPETGGALLALTREVFAAGRPCLGSRPDAVAQCGSKHATAARLAAAGIATIPTWWRDEAPGSGPGPWVVKPDDGAGCGDTRRLPSLAAARAVAGAGLVLQPWVEGEAASLTLLCRDGRAALLTVNRQDLVIEGDALRLAGCRVNALDDADGRLAALADAVAGAFPGLRGLAGVDLVLTPDGPVVVEVNPRLTTSCVALQEATGLNPAALVLDPDWPPPAPVWRRMVEVKL